MNLVDTNVLLYAANERSEYHDAARSWLDRAINGSGTLLLPWLNLVAYLRISTNARAFDRALSVEDAMADVEEWLASPNVVTPQPDVRHLHRMGELVAAAGGRGGNLVDDAHLAALAVQYGATIVTFDTDFALFPGVKWMRPS